MYGRSEDGAAVVVVDAVVVDAVVVCVVVVGVMLVVCGAVVGEPDAVVDVGVSDVVPAPLVAVDVDPDEVVSVEPEEVSLEVELEKVLPNVIGETSPRAPETSRPSMKTAAAPTAILIRRP